MEDGRTILHHVFLSEDVLDGTKRISSRSRSASLEAVEVEQYLDLCTDEHVPIILDVEATGLDTRHVRVFQLAAKVHGGTDTFNAFIDPGVPIPADVVELTGVEESMLRESGRQFSDVWQEFQQWVAKVSGGKQVVLLAHNGRAYDFRVLANEVQRHRLAPKEADGGNGLRLPGVVCCIDTVQVLRDKAIWSVSALSSAQINGEDSANSKGAPDKFNQRHLYFHLFGEEPVGAHNALSDVQHLDAILSVPFIRDRWRAVANSRQFLLE